MNGTFHQTLSQLRKNRRVSQREVASDLYISQALLSHYENGIREPGLDFVNRACDYFDVSADFLLGRTVDTAAPCEDAKTLETLLQTVAELDDEALSSGLFQCFSAISYRLLRHAAALDPELDTSALSVPAYRAASLSDLACCQGEARFIEALDALLGEARTSAASKQLESLLTDLDAKIGQLQHTGLK